METLYGNDPPPPTPPRVLALGVFDGVHRGHQAILHCAREWARAEGALAEAITFDRHPTQTVGARPDEAPRCLTSLRHRLLLFEGLGLDRCRVLTFEPDLARMPADAFMRRFFAGAAGVVMGYDQRFGRRREAGAESVRRMGEAMGFDVRVVAPVEVHGAPVSSTRIRRAVERGDLALAADLLGRPLSLLGRVVRGDGRGRRIGFPTANLDLGGEIHPPEGVYLTTCRTPAGRYPSLTNVGRRPTFARGRAWTGPAIVEVHLLDFEGDLYGAQVEVFFAERLRDEVACGSPEELQRLIAQDTLRARERFAAND